MADEFGFSNNKQLEPDDFYYSEQGYIVFTEKYLFKRGYCCQNGWCIQSSRYFCLKAPCEVLGAGVYGIARKTAD